MTKLIVTLAIGILAFAANSSAQTVTRIKFAKGQSSTVVRGTTGPEGISYVLKAKGGQKVILRLTPASGVGIKVESDRSYGHVVLLKAKTCGTAQSQERWQLRNADRGNRRLHDLHWHDQG